MNDQSRKYQQLTELVTVEDVKERLQEQGYSLREKVLLNGSDGPVLVDLLAEKDGEAIAFEVLSRLDNRSPYDRALRVKKIRQAYPGLKVKALYIEPIKEVTVELDGLDEILKEYILNNLPPDLADWGSGRVVIEDIYDLEYFSVKVNRSGIKVVGHGNLDAEMEAGDRNDSITFSESFPFNFSVQLTHEMEITGTPEIAVDTSGWFCE